MRTLVLALVTLSLATVACAGSDGNVRINGDEAAASEAGRDAGAPNVLHNSGRPDASASDASNRIDGEASDAGTSDAKPADAGADANDAGADDASADASDAAHDAEPDAAIANPCFDVALGKNRAIVKPAVGDLTISEWMPDPTAVNDAAGEWAELRVTKDVDLNGLQIGNATLGLPLISSKCLRAEAGSFVVFARSTDPSLNGLDDAPVIAPLPVFLPNGSGTLSIGIDGTTLDTVSWNGALGGVSKMIDHAGVMCSAPVSVPAYNGIDVGTPGAPNVDCP